MKLRTRVIVLAIMLGLCGGGIGALFWQQEMRYSLPTPVPIAYQPVSVGSDVMLPSSLTTSSAYFFHFYNPDCPCSRFNIRHLRSLIGTFRDSISIIVVVPSWADESKARNEFGDKVSIIIDDGSLAKRCGVYSTPQAAIVDGNQKLYYRGNYNRSRYCTQRATNFAELSLIALLNKNPPPAFGIVATQSYGCELKDANSPDFEFF